MKILHSLEHRGAIGEDPLAGDGCGMMVQLVHEFFTKVAPKARIKLPAGKDYAVGMVFLPRGLLAKQKFKKIIASVLRKRQLKLLGWRKVPTDNSCLSKSMLPMEPAIEQFFVESNNSFLDIFERNLYVARRIIENKVEESNYADKEFFYIASLSAKTIVYKGMLTSQQFDKYFMDINDADFKSSLALVHHRYSTNTFPSWGLAHPFRIIAHNGEINTLRSNINWSKARESQLSSDLFGTSLNKVLPVITSNGSDSSAFDNTLEFLTMAGRSVEHAIMLMMPQAWENDNQLDPALKSFYTYSSALLEPWDGPAAISFCDGDKIGAMLDRNGLRPARYFETTDGLFVLASETGVLPVAENKIRLKGKLGPGEIVMVDTMQGDVLFDNEIKLTQAKSHPYQRWVDENVILLKNLPSPAAKSMRDKAEIRLSNLIFGYTAEQINLLLKPMAEKSTEAIYAMGTDTPLAVLSKLPKTIYYYFKQMFAQVTNPAIDSIREEVVMSLTSVVGGGRNILEDNPQHCHALFIEQPILNNSQLEQLRNLQTAYFRSCEISICYELYQTSLKKALAQLFKKAEEKIDEGYRLLVLSDRDLSSTSAPIPALLAVSGLHHHLIKVKKRGKVGIIIETGEAREVHDFACLLSYGAGAVNPYLAFETISQMAVSGLINVSDQYQAQENYIIAIKNGLKKIFAKMGISTLHSYQAAQILEPIGLSSELLNEYFTGADSFFEGVGLEELQADLIYRHQQAYKLRSQGVSELLTGGEYNWRIQGEYHAYNPETIHFLQQASWLNDRSIYDKFKNLVDDKNNPWTIRGLLTFDYKKRKPVRLSEVETVEEILKRFSSGAMSIGAISKEAHETLAIALNELGGRSNTGEGGEDELRFKISADGRLRRSAIKQVASGRFGVTSNYLVNADEIQIKIAQGAKPGEGGQIWGGKVDDYIAKLRHTIPGVTLISPPPHHDIYSIEDLSQLIFDLKNANDKADVSVKLVSSGGVGAVAAGVSKAKADGITISGYDGGTGASPATSIKHAGLPWEIGLAEVQQALVINNLRSKVRLQVDGHIKTGRDVIIGAMLGAEDFGFATSLLVATGCIMMRKCHLNTCPVGIATQNVDLRSKYRGKPEHVKNYLTFVAEDVREWMAKLGYRKFEDMIGESDHLVADESIINQLKFKIDLSRILYKPASRSNIRRNTAKQDNLTADVLDRVLLDKVKNAIENKRTVLINNQIIKNSNRTVGTLLGSMVSRQYGAAGLPEDTIKINFTGSAGQSFGAFLPCGLTLNLTGDANDYVGKGLSGGKIILKPPAGVIYNPHESSIAGNTCLYGATSGRAYFYGRVGQRFAVRNSGCLAVVEMIGDHGCEYMTGGRVVVLGKTGKNFAAGMSGGIAYVYDPKRNFGRNCNMVTVELEQVLGGKYADELYDIITDYYEYTQSLTARMILQRFARSVANFVMVVPFEYRKVLAA